MARLEHAITMIRARRRRRHYSMCKSKNGRKARSAMSREQDNTIVTIGDVHYLWGIFLLVASTTR